MICPSCGISVPVDARFCPSCGQTLQARADERRVATVLFADLAGFTSLSEHMDPEQVKNLVDRCFQRLVADVSSFGGRVDKIVGDAIIALFGAPVAHEDDAERAVRAALAMRTTLEALATELGIDVRMRIGVNTGEVLVGGLRAGGDYTAMGDVVNTAERLQSAAQPGQVLVGTATHSATENAIRYEALGAVRAKGRQEPVDAWIAIEATAPPGYRRRSRSPLVGRETELGLLEHALKMAATRRRPQLVLLLGDAGMGKSRLADELAAIARAEYDAMVLEGRCVPYGEANIWWPVAEAIRSACGVDDTDPVDVALQKCKEALAAALGESSEAHDVATAAQGLLYIMGHQKPELSLHNVDPARARDESLRSVRLLIEGLARRRMVTIVLGELHWADAQVLEALGHFLDRVRGVPLVVIATARPELESRWTLGSAAYNLLTIKLDPLDDEAAAGMMTALLGARPPRALRDVLLERSGGNPLFMEELVSLLREAGVLVEEGGLLRLDITRDLGDVPPTLRGLVSARLDALTVPERSALEDAAVVGRTGQLEAVVALASARGSERPLQIVEGLASRDLLVVDEGRYEFKSDLVREIAYETLTKAERARRHAALAVWLSGSSRETGREDEFLEQFAHHYAMAAEFSREIGTVDGVPTDIAQRALGSLERAARRAELRDSNRLAIHHLDHAWNLVADGNDRARRRVLLARARARTQLRELQAAREDLDLVLSESTAEDDTPSIAGALTVLGELEHREGASERSVETLQRALDMWRELGDEEGAAHALRSLGETEMFAGRAERAEEHTREALGLFRNLGDRRGEAWALRNLAWIAFMHGDLAAAERRLQASATTYSEIQDRGGQSWALGFLAWVRFMQGFLDEAEAIAVPIVAESDGDAGGDPFGAGMMRVLMGALRVWRGRHSEGIEWLREARTILTRIGDAWGQTQSILPLAAALVAKGDIDDGLQALEEGLAVATSLSDPRMRAFAKTMSAGIALNLGEPARAERELAEASRAFKPLAEGYGDPDHVRALAHLQFGRAPEGRAELEAVLAGATSEGLRANVAGVLSLAYAAEGRPDEAIRAAAEIDRLKGGTYRDRVVAGVARGLAQSQLDRFEEAEATFAATLETIDASEGRLDQAIVRLAYSRALEALGSPHAAEVGAEAARRFAELGVHGRGWQVLFTMAAGARVSAPASDDA